MPAPTRSSTERDSIHENLEDQILLYHGARDKLQWTKVWHRTLYTVGKDARADSNLCTMCDEEENILHLAGCRVIREEFWDVILELLSDLGMPTPENTTAFFILGRLDEENTIDAHLAGIVFLAWRCLYAELTRAHVDREREDPDMDSALRRVQDP